MASLKESSPETKDTMAEALAKTWMRQYKAEANFPEWTKTQKTITEPLLLPDNPRTSQDDSSFSLKQVLFPKACQFSLPQLYKSNTYVDSKKVLEGSMKMSIFYNVAK